jgi:periplasmic divalent cation tolerance protein
MTDFVLVLTTVPPAGAGGRIARALVEERLAACVSESPPMSSTYRWQGEVTEDREQQLVIKTTRGQLAALERRLRELHPYEVPEFLIVEVSGGSQAYLGWVRDNVGLE